MALMAFEDMYVLMRLVRDVSGEVEDGGPYAIMGDLCTRETKTVCIAIQHRKACKGNNIAVAQAWTNG